MKRKPLSAGVETSISSEIEGYLRDLVFQHHFHTIFEALKRYEYQNRFGANVVPIPGHPVSIPDLQLVIAKIDRFLDVLRRKYGLEYDILVKRSFQSFTATTMPVPTQVIG